MQPKMNRTPFASEQQKRQRQQELKQRAELGQQAELIRALLQPWHSAQEAEVLDKLRKANSIDDLTLVRGQLLGLDSVFSHLQSLVNQGDNAMAALKSSIPARD